MTTYMHYTKLLLLVGLLVPAIGCDEFLEEQPTSFINPSTFFQTSSDAEAAVVAGYDFYGGFNPTTYGWWRDFVFEGLHDDFVLRPTANPNNTASEASYEAFGPASSNVSTVYQNFSEGLNTFSVAVDGIEGMNAFDKQAALAGEAKFLRAFSYFTLVRLFGRVPIIDHALTGKEARSLPRASSIDEVYTLIISDLEAGAANLPEVASAPGRATKWAAMSLLAKVHLTRENWSEAARLAREVIEQSNRELLPVYTDIFRDDNENNAESIFEIQMVIGDERSNQVGNWPRGIGPDSDQDYFQGPNWGGVYIASDDFLNSFEEGDIRRNLISTSYLRSDGTLIEFNADGLPANYPLKRVPRSYLEGIESNNNSGYNFIYLRLGEVYLIAAEAENEAGNTDAAYPYVNAIRQRVGLPPLIGLSQGAFRTVVRAERRHELYDERTRLFDLLRWGNLVERTLAVKPDAAIQPFHLLWPVPQSAIDRNPALEGDQNPGY